MSFCLPFLGISIQKLKGSYSEEIIGRTVILWDHLDVLTLKYIPEDYK